MNSVTKPSRATRWIRVGVAGLTSLVVVAGVSSGCLDRPVAEQEPSTSNVFVTQFKQTAVDKIDLLFMVDNSQSMADKQAILAQAVPQLVRRLLNPPCVDGNGNAVGAQPITASDKCDVGATREFEPIADVHIGVISSSLGGAGGPFCTEAAGAEYDVTQVDMAHLMGTVRPDLGGTPQGFLDWDNRPAAVRDASAFNDIDSMIGAFTNHVVAPGEVGCGFEASLEAWYRFLIDPSPYANVIVEPATSLGTKDGVDQAILDQRAAFLRGDSLVAVIMLTDENDCSIQASGLGNLVTTFTRPSGQFLMRRGSTACDANPNDPCCISCATAAASWPGGCASKAELCPNGDIMSGDEDASNLRCFDQKRRFGIDLLYPTSRYSVGLRAPQLCPNSSFPDADCDCVEAARIGASCSPGDPVINPLYSQGNAIIGRQSDLVFLAGIVGVPWQEIATPDTRDDPTRLRYLLADEIDWNRIVGDPDNYAPPESPYMVESVLPREGLPGPDSTSPTADAIHGHEWNTSGRDLQYACIFPLPQDLVEDCATVPEGENCDCAPNVDPDDGSVTLAEVEAARKPLCQGEDGAMGSVQYRAKAYPGLRELEVLRDYGTNSIVASVCPKTLDGIPTDPSYGYNPAVSSIVDRLKEKLGGKCLPRALAVDEETGLVPCEVVEAMLGDVACDPTRGRVDLSDKSGLVSAVRAAIKETGGCESPSSPRDCDEYNMCGIQQYVPTTPDGALCLTEPGDAPDVDVPGYCYIDAMDPDPLKHIGNAELVANCEPSQKRLLRFTGSDTPARGSITFIACSGQRIR